MSHAFTGFTFKLAAILFALGADIGVDRAIAAGDPARGARDFRPCMACHSVKPGDHSTGPSLANLWNRKAGTVDGFAGYSSTLKDADVEWNESSLDKWLSSPQQFMPGTSMKFQGIADAQERADIIAYLRAVSGNMAAELAQQGASRQGGGRPNDAVQPLRR